MSGVLSHDNRNTTHAHTQRKDKESAGVKSPRGGAGWTLLEGREESVCWQVLRQSSIIKESDSACVSKVCELENAGIRNIPLNSHLKGA